MKLHHLRNTCLTAVFGTIALAPLPLRAQQTEEILLDAIVISAEDQAKQALGSSVISAEDLEKQPVTNDLSEAIRKMPGVNLTGNTTSGQRGNSRQIDIRGMGPENTLILIDGKPVLARNSVKMSRGGERDTRGDSNWIPPELVERVEVLRGPAAARYGSGASGGVVNIITKRPDTFTGQVGLHFGLPESSKEGGTKRTNFMLAGPAGKKLTFRVFGNYNETDGDDADLNQLPPVDGVAAAPYAGREGVVNKDIGSLLTWEIAPGHEIDFEANFSRQGNSYAGDTRNGTVDANGPAEGTETNRMYRRTLGLTHRGEYGFGESMSYLQWENSRNSRYCSGIAGRVEDNPLPCVDTDGDGVNDAYRYDTIELDNIAAKTEWTLPLTLASKASRVTFGAEYRGEFMNDPHSIQNTVPDDIGGETGVDPDPANRSADSEQNTVGLYTEANIQWTGQLMLTPGLRFDYSDTFGNSWSPSLNATYAVTDEWTVKVGVARAFKTPNLFQLNPNYVYNTAGNGCPYVDGIRITGPCYVLGNPDLEAERSVNKEIGISYDGFNGIDASLTYFYNDYQNRVAAGINQLNDTTTDRLYRWENQGKAVISGLEGSFAAELGDNFGFTTNFTKMIKSKKDDGQPLSLVPEYTINASVDWYATEALTVTLSATHYGEIDAPTRSATNQEYTETEKRSPYTLVNLGTAWNITETARVSAGVTNLFDKSILRTGSGSSANTFNEPGRAFYLSLNKTF